ncbi:MAG: DNA glycosylase [Dehalococcoidales bacterium]|jgi:TDG/mug DNA glycosylase family protein|nr:DNA glycosylase [Dehalococcoidales bacterium]MDP6136991.1 mismatch-specific DNA-glycosylase [Arenicellales bacterium]
MKKHGPRRPRLKKQVVGQGRPIAELPLLLADLHLSLPVAEEINLELVPNADSGWTRQRALDLVVGAGFTAAGPVRVGGPGFIVSARRIRSLPDTVAPGMRLLIVGLNPSPYSADHGIGYGRPGNRFWPAALEAGLVSVDRDPRHALLQHGLGMTDLVRRTTNRADQVEPAEFACGFERVERLAAWLKPKVCCFVGLGGWRGVVDRKAVAGPQDRLLGGRLAYVMPHTSGLNAHSRLADLAAHLQAAGAMADRAQ